MVLRSPHSPNEQIAKRVVGLPGDWVLPRKQADDRGERPSPVPVPRGHLWVEGDNAKSSNDSTSFGTVPAGLVEARVAYKLWPLSEAGPVARRELAPERVLHRSVSADAAAASQRSEGLPPWNISHPSPAWMIEDGRPRHRRRRQEQLEERQPLEEQVGSQDQVGQVAPQESQLAPQRHQLPVPPLPQQEDAEVHQEQRSHRHLQMPEEGQQQQQQQQEQQQQGQQHDNVEQQHGQQHDKLEQQQQEEQHQQRLVQELADQHMQQPRHLSQVSDSETEPHSQPQAQGQGQSESESPARQTAPGPVNQVHMAAQGQAQGQPVIDVK